MFDFGKSTSESCGTLKKETQLSASGGVVPQDYMNSTWDAAVQKTLGAEEMGYLKGPVFLGRGYLPFKIWMGLFAIKAPLYLWDTITIHSQMKSRTNVFFSSEEINVFVFSLYGRMAIASSAMLLEMFSSISHNIGVIRL